jgi:hypothetical protein
MTLFEGQTASHFESFYDWDLSILEQLPNGGERVYTIPYEEMPDPGEVARFRAEGLPFDVEVSGFLRNCEPQPARGHGSAAPDAFVLSALPAAKEAEQNVAGLTVRLQAPGGVRVEALLWGLQRAPFATKIDGRRWAIDLHKRRWPLPFSVTLRDFQHDLHPRTGIASSYSSDVTRTEDNVAQDIHISMNEPMRHRGYTFYQSGWGPQNAPPGTRLFSTFSVVSNPADRGPLVACIIIASGLLVHFIRKLVLHIDSERRRA